MTQTRAHTHFNWHLLWITMVLCIIGLINLFSAGHVWGHEGYPKIFTSQLIWVTSGFFLAGLILFIDYRVFERLAYPLYWITIVGLIAALLFGKSVAGHKSWLTLFNFTFQPSEFAKIGFILALSKYLNFNQTIHNFTIRDLIKPFGLLFIPLSLILVSGDLGSALFFILTFITLILFAGIQRKTFMQLAVIGIASILLAYVFLLSPYQKARIQTFLDPARDPRGQGYHLLQSKIAVGSGQFLGKGYMKGMMNKLMYVPEKHTDFIFAVLLEEWGFLGGMAVLSLYLAMLTIGISIASKAKERFGIFLALGITALIFWQIVINVGGILGLLPLTGVTLPLLSYGGSSVVTILAGIGFLLNISMRRFMF
jgi:rod shape determining protein RodA